MRVKIHGGTANNSESPLCLTGRFATVVKGRTLRDEIVECRRVSDHARITFPVRFCTGYADARQASIREMEEIAWILRSDPSRNQIGFVQARKLKPADRQVLPDEWDWKEKRRRTLVRRPPPSLCELRRDKQSVNQLPDDQITR